MNPDAWPTPSEGASREPLPRLEELPVAPHGYDQASVKAAFDSFYRHAAQLDAALRTLEAVDSFQRQAAALRADLRTLRTSGWTQQPFAAPPAYGYDTRAPREGVSPAVWRILGEVIFLIAVSVFLGIAKVPWWVIVSVMGGAFLIVAIIEWAASRDRWSAPAPARVAPHPVVEAEQAPAQGGDEAEPIGWAAFEEAEQPSDAMTMIGAPHEAAVEEEALAKPAVQSAEPEASEVAEPQPVAEVDEPEPVAEAVPHGTGDDAPLSPETEPAVAPASEPAPELAADGEPVVRRRGWRRRLPAVAEPVPEPDAESGEAPRHVRVLGTDEDAAQGAVDPWEQGFDPGPDGGEGAEAAEPAQEPDEETGDNGGPVAAEAESPSRRRFRRR